MLSRDLIFLRRNVTLVWRCLLSNYRGVEPLRKSLLYTKRHTKAQGYSLELWAIYGTLRYPYFAS